METTTASGDWKVVLPVLIINYILITIALIDCFRAESIRGPKWLWVPIILLVLFLGPILYFIFGKKYATRKVFDDH